MVFACKCIFQYKGRTQILRAVVFGGDFGLISSKNRYNLCGAFSISKSFSETVFGGVEKSSYEELLCTRVCLQNYFCYVS